VGSWKAEREIGKAETGTALTAIRKVLSQVRKVLSQWNTVREE
jgi:hypothetical protein